MWASRVCLAALLLLVALFGAAAQSPSPAYFSKADLAEAFRGAQVVDLHASKASSVVALREMVKIPPPSEPVLVKTFEKNSLPSVLQPAFEKPGTMGVTIAGRYIAILATPFEKEYADVLRHELVHAYISMASPKPLPFWFQEGSAVHFSIDKGRKFYGKPDEKRPGVMVGRTVELNDVYKQKLRSFHFLIEQAGKQRFYEWYRNAVETGVVDARPLLGLKPGAEPMPPRRQFPLWLGAVIGLAVVVVAVVGYYASRNSSDDRLTIEL